MMPAAESRIVSAEPASALISPMESAAAAAAGSGLPTASQSEIGCSALMLSSASIVTITPKKTRSGAAVQAARRAVCAFLAAKVRENMSGPIR